MSSFSGTLMILLSLLLPSQSFGQIRQLTPKEREVIKQITVEAVVRVMEAPAFDRPDWRANIVKRYKKGDVIKLHARAKREADPFYLFTDPLGRPAYIPRDFVKVYHNNLSELELQKLDSDPTDYRISEPLSSKYPFARGKKRRASIQVGLGQQGKPNYSYPAEILKENYGNTFDMHATYQRSPDFDIEERFFFGIAGYISTFENKFTLKGQRIAREKWEKLGIGPHASWQFVRYPPWIVELGGGIYYNVVNQLTISQSSGIPGEGEETRKFSKFSFSPFLHLTLKLQSPQESIRFILNVMAKTDYPNALLPRSEVKNSSWWDPDEKNPKVLFNIDAALFFGVELNT